MINYDSQILVSLFKILTKLSIHIILVKKITDQGTFEVFNQTMMSSAEEEDDDEEEDEEDIDTSSASPIHAFPPPSQIMSYRGDQHQLPSISALMTDHSSDILPPLRKRPNNRH